MSRTARHVQIGTYQSKRGQAYGIVKGTYNANTTGNEQETACIPCEVGRYASTTSTQCQECPPGSHCPNTTTSEYYRVMQVHILIQVAIFNANHVQRARIKRKGVCIFVMHVQLVNI